MVTQDVARQDRIDAEASAWLAKIQGDRRTPDTDAALQAWLQADPAHEAAFERATELWEMLPGIAAVGEATAANDRAPKPKSRALPIAACIAAAVVVVGMGGGYAFLHRTPVYVTAVGQQQVTILPDGSRISLNTDSQVSVLYTGSERRVRLDKGEAMFDVAHDAAHPFIVMAGDEQVRALGTSFVVRRQADRVAVTLVRGKVQVSKIEPARPKASQLTPVAVLTPGERLTLIGDTNPTVDTPSIDAVTAWRRGEVVFADTTLGDAVTEINRYGPTQVVVDDPDVAKIRISGVFATNDAAEFAAAMAQLNGLRVVKSEDRIELRRP